MPYTDKRIIIHLGLPKAASTFLQEQVFGNYENTTYLNPAFVSLSTALNQLMFKPDTHYNPRLIAELIQQIPDETVIISHEFLSCGLAEAVFRRETVIKRLSRLFPNAHFLFFIRNQLDWMTSIYNYYIANGGKVPVEKYFWLGPEKGMSLEKYLGNQASNKSLQPQNYTATHQQQAACPAYILDYYECIRLYKKHTDNLHVFLQEDLQADTPQLVQSISDIVQQPCRKTTGYTAANVSGAAWIIPLRRVARKLARLNLGLGLYNKVSEWITKYTWGKSYQLPENLQQQIRERFRENNRKTAGAFPEIGLQRHKKAYFLED